MAPHRPELTGCKPRVSAARAKRRAKQAEGSDEARDETAAAPDDEESGEQEPTPPRELVSYAHDRPPPIRGPPAAYSIAEFCVAHRISQSMYFKLRNMGLGPREMAVGSRRLISQEAAAEWRKAREAAASAA
jgi:hypothetical protein